MKKAVIISCALIFVLFLCGVVVLFLVGNFSSGYNCLYKGPLARVSSGPCSITLKDFSNSEIQFKYNDKLTLKEDTGVIYLYKLDPTKVAKGDFNDNLIITKEPESIDLTQKSCEDYVNSTLSAMTADYYQVSVKNTSMETINGKKSCRIEIDTTITLDKKYELTQVVYLFNDKGNKPYGITISTAKGTDSYAGFINTVYSFNIK